MVNQDNREDLSLKKKKKMGWAGLGWGICVIYIIDGSRIVGNEGFEILYVISGLGVRFLLISRLG